MKWLITLATTIALTVPAVAASQTKKGAKRGNIQTEKCIQSRTMNSERSDEVCGDMFLSGR